MSKDEQAIKAPRKILRVEWVIPDDLVPRYATNMVVQHSEHEFTLSFFALEKPIILGSPEERQKAVENITSARAKCVAQVIVSPERMKDFVSVLDANYQIYKDKVK